MGLICADLELLSAEATALFINRLYKKKKR